MKVMAQYIDKSALVAEIKRRMDENGGKQTLPQYFGMIEEDLNILSFIDTLKVKEVNYKPIDNDFERDAVNFCFDNGLNTTPRIAKTIAKHFFKLGMCAANPLTVKDIEKIYHLVNEVSDDLGVRAMYVNIYQETLKRFKAQKG